MTHAEIVVQHPVGLHARPAAVLVRMAASFPAAITISKIGAGTKQANAKSILAVLSLGVNQGDQIAIDAEGERAEEALRALLDLVQTNFGESSSPANG